MHRQNCGKTADRIFLAGLQSELIAPWLLGLSRVTTARVVTGTLARCYRLRSLSAMSVGLAANVPDRERTRVQAGEGAQKAARFARN